MNFMEDEVQRRKKDLLKAIEKLSRYNCETEHDYGCCGEDEIYSHGIMEKDKYGDYLNFDDVIREIKDL